MLQFFCCCLIPGVITYCFRLEMGRTSELSPTKRARIISMKTLGVKDRAISAELKIAPSTVSKTWKRHLELGHFEARKRSGRPKKTTERLDKLIVRSSLKQRRKTVPDLRAELQTNSNVVVSNSTVRRRLTKAGLTGRIARKKPLEPPKNWSIPCLVDVKLLSK